MPPELQVVPDEQASEKPLCPWGTHTSVIGHIEFQGKWVEIWFEAQNEPSPNQWDYCSKRDMLEDAIDKAGLRRRVDLHGYLGLGVVRTDADPNFEISSVFEARRDFGVVR